MQQFSVIQAEEVACSLCRFQCEHRDQILRLAEEGKERYKAALNYFNRVDYDQKTKAFINFAQVILQITQIKAQKNLDLAWCYTKEMWLRLEGEPLGEDRKELFFNVFQDLI